MESISQPVDTKLDWSILALFRLGAFGFGMTGFFMAMDTIVLPTLVLEVAPEGAKNALLGGLGFSGLLVAAVVQPIIGWYSDRIRSPLGRRVPFMIWSTAFVCLGLAGLAFKLSFLSLLIIWIFMQANASIGYGPFQAVIRDLVPVHRIGIASSLKILSDASGGVTLVAVSGFLIGQFSGSELETVQWLWITLSVIALTVLVSNVISSTTIATRERNSAMTQRVSRAPQWVSTNLHPQLSWFLISRFLFITSIFVFPTYGLFFLRDVIGVANPAQTLGTMILAIGGALALSVYPAGWLSDQVGRKPVVFTAALVAALGTVSLLWASNATQVLVIASVIGASIGGLLSANWALANELGTAGREGQHMGLVTLASVAGAATSKVLGPGVDLLNLAVPGSGYAALLVGASGAFVLGALLLLPLKPEHPIAPQPDDTTHQAAT